MISLATGAVLLAALAARPALQDDPEAEARLELARAEELVVKGRYAKAVRAYEKLAAEYPDTEAGRIARERSRPTAFIGWADLVRNGPSANRVDVVVMGDGYTLDQQDAFDDVAKVVPRLFERNETLGEYWSYFNFLRANLVSAEAGVDGYGREYDTALDGRTIGTIQGHVAIDGQLAQRMLDELPEHDSLAVAFVKQGNLGTGSPGVATIGGRNDKTLIHEWGHAFALLGDEYDTSTGHRGSVDGRINVSGTDDPEQVPWKHWLEAGVRGVGIYEGADGRAKGAWKPTTNCIMADGGSFCPVCREALVLRIYELVDPIDSATPEPHPQWGSDAALRGPGPFEFEVQAMTPSNHALEATWFVFPEGEEPLPPSGASARYGYTGTRRDRGPLPAIRREPLESSKGNRKGLHRFELTTDDLAPGRYRVVCRVRDTTELRGERHPWVLLDRDGLLEGECGWWVDVERAP